MPALRQTNKINTHRQWMRNLKLTLAVVCAVESRLSLVASNRWIPAIFCMSCEVTAVHKFALRLVISEAPNGNQWKGHTVTQTDVFDRIYMFSPDRRHACSGGYTLVTLPRTVTPYRDSVDGTRDHVTYRKLVTRSRYGLVRCAVGIWLSHQRDDTVTAEAGVDLQRDTSPPPLCAIFL